METKVKAVELRGCKAAAHSCVLMGLKGHGGVEGWILRSWWETLPLLRMLTGSVHTSLPGAFPSPTCPANLLVPAQDGKLTLYLT